MSSNKDLSIYSNFSSDLKMLKRPVSDTLEIFDIYPVQKGFGITLANSIRRTLYSIRGVKIDWFKISGIRHQFSHIDGVSEDLIAISLNMKDVVIKSDNLDSSSALSLGISKSGAVFAGDISCPEGVEIVNKDLYLFTVVKNVSISMEIGIKVGFGVEISREDVIQASDGRVFLNKFYTPVKNVSFDVSNYIYNGNAEDFEKIELEILTDGSMVPSECLDIACAIGSGMFGAIMDLNNKSAQELRDVIASSHKSNILIQTGEVHGKVSKNDALITHIEFSVRTMNCLKYMPNVKYLGDLERFTQKDLLAKKNFGKKSLQEVEQRMQERGFALRIANDDEEDEFDDEDDAMDDANLEVKSGNSIE